MPVPRSTSDTSRRSQHTRHRLVHAGLKLFGTRDFDNVTTRQLADTAQVNLAAIRYHFGSKENVYLAVAEHILASVSGETLADLKALQTAVETPGSDTETLFGLLHRFLLSFGHEVLGVEDSALRAGFILREQLHPSAAFDLLYEGFMCQVHRCLSTLYAHLLGHDREDPQMLYRAQALIGQVLGFRMAREVLLRRLGVADIDHAEVTAFIADQNIKSLRGEVHEAR